MGCCQGAGNRAENVLRGPVAIRVVTNTVLLVSDTDVFFSIMFARQLIKEGGVFFFFLGAMALGLVVYAAGVCYFGPRNKFRTVKNLKLLMNDSPGEFKSGVTDPPTTVGVATPLDPHRRGRGRTFADLSCDEEGLKDATTSMAAWKLTHMWTYAEKKIALNVCEVKHGIPFLRLARFGFVASPTPKDLAGILNANALYSVATGIFQVFGGVFLIFSVGNADLMVLLPLSISLCSLVLSAFNVFLDFSGTLTEIEAEHRLAENIKTKIESQRTEGKKRLEDQLESEKARIDSKYRGRTDVAACVEKQKELEIATNIYSHGLEGVEANAMDILNVEMDAHRSRLEQSKQAMKGRTRSSVKRRRGAFEEFQRSVEPWERKKDEIRRGIQQEIDALDVGLGADQIELKISEIQAEADRKIDLFDRQIEKIRIDTIGTVTVFGEPATGP